MSSPALFSTGASPTSAVSRNLVEFKAGKMEVRDKMVHPIKKQGTVYLHQSTDDTLIHFCWKDRNSGVVEDDLILFPDDCEFKRVKECKTGRVFVLKLKSSNKKMFFWMQEPATSKDDEYCRKINEILNNPPRQGSDVGGGSHSERELQSILGGITRDQLAQLVSSSNGMLPSNLAGILNSTSSSSSSPSAAATAAAAAAAAARSPSSVSSTRSTTQSGAQSVTSGIPESQNMDEFRQMLSNFEGNEEEAQALYRALRASQPSRDSTPMIDLSTVINSESLAHLLSDEEFLKQIEPHLPPITQDQPASSDKPPVRDQLEATLRSQQFKSSMSQFCVALQSGQLGPLMAQFGLSSACVDAATRGNLEAFVKALEAEKKSSSDGNASKE